MDKRTVIWIHSINETEKLTTLDTLSKNNTVIFSLPVKVLTRNSQKEQYQKILEKYMTFTDLELITVEDSLISNLGKTKNYEIQKSYEDNISNIFMFDDDITKLILKNQEHSDPEEILLYWLNMHEQIAKVDKHCIVTSVLKDLSKAKPSSRSELYKGICTQCTLLNTKRAVESSILYRGNDIVGHEDVDYRAQLIEAGKTYYRLTEIIYGTEPLNTDTFEGDTLQERFTRQREVFKKVWGDKYPWIIYTTTVINGIELNDIKLDPSIVEKEK